MDEKTSKISVKSFIQSLAVIFAIMVFTYVLTFIIPAGEFARTLDENGNSIIDISVPFKTVEGGLPFWKWILSPFLVLGSEGSGLLIGIIAFLLILGGVFKCLNSCGMIEYLLKKIVSGFASSRYALMAVVVFFIMLLGSFVGSFEEIVPMVPIIVALAVGLGWDKVTGVGMSLLAAGCGFAAGIMNPFSVGIAQSLAGLQMFSGFSLRVFNFFMIYFLLMACLIIHGKRIEKPVSLEKESFVKNPDLEKATKAFAGIMIFATALVISSAFFTFLQDYTIIIIALMFLIAGTVSVSFAKIGVKPFFKTFGQGVIEILPSTIMILMASSIKYILTESKILDTILNYAVNISENLPTFCIILFIYLIVLVMNFFIASGSAKAFLLIPLIMPIAQLCGISKQLCIVAFAFGDGFSNVFYPTNPALLISLSLSDIRYGEYAKWAWKFQALNLLLTSGILLMGYFIGY